MVAPPARSATLRAMRSTRWKLRADQFRRAAADCRNFERRGVERAMRFERVAGKFGIAAALALELAQPRLRDSPGDPGAGLAVGAAASASGATAGTSTCKSMRSSSGPLIRP